MGNTRAEQFAIEALPLEADDLELGIISATLIRKGLACLVWCERADKTVSHGSSFGLDLAKGITVARDRSRNRMATLLALRTTPRHLPEPRRLTA